MNKLYVTFQNLLSDKFQLPVKKTISHAVHCYKFACMLLSVPMTFCFTKLSHLFQGIDKETTVWRSGKPPSRSHQCFGTFQEVFQYSTN